MDGQGRQTMPNLEFHQLFFDEPRPVQPSGISLKLRQQLVQFGPIRLCQSKLAMLS